MFYNCVSFVCKDSGTLYYIVIILHCLALPTVVTAHVSDDIFEIVLMQTIHVDNAGDHHIYFRNDFKH